MLEHDWHAHASLVPPAAGEDGSAETGSAAWELHLHVTEPVPAAQVAAPWDAWHQQPADLVLVALENLHWA